jgi:hypothetical protein
MYLACARELAMCADKASWTYGAHFPAYLRDLKPALWRRVAPLFAAPRDPKISSDLVGKIARLVSQVGKLLLCENDETRRAIAYLRLLGQRARAVLRAMDAEPRDPLPPPNVVKFPSRPRAPAKRPRHK